MEATGFIFIIEAEHHYNVLVRIITIFNRQRTPPREFSSRANADKEKISITIAFEENHASAIKLFKRLEKEIDIISVHLFEQLHHNPKHMVLTHNC